MGVVPPLDGFNAALRRITAAHGALLILDEVMTGFRVSRSGWYGIDPVDADLFTFGKVMGGGLPAAAFGGRADLMDQLAPIGPVYQAGTLSGNPVAVAAGLTTLRHCTDEVYAHCDEVGGRPARRGQRGAVRRGRPAPRAAGRQHVLDLLRARRAPGARLRRRPHPGRRAGTPPSSTRCWPAGSTCRRRRSRRGSSTPRSSGEALDRVLGRAARRRARRRRGRGA